MWVVIVFKLLFSVTSDWTCGTRTSLCENVWNASVCTYWTIWTILGVDKILYYVIRILYDHIKLMGGKKQYCNQSVLIINLHKCSHCLISKHSYLSVNDCKIAKDLFSVKIVILSTPKSYICVAESLLSLCSSVQLRSWSPDEKSHRLSRPLSQVGSVLFIYLFITNQILFLFFCSFCNCCFWNTHFQMFTTVHPVKEKQLNSSNEMSLISRGWMVFSDYLMAVFSSQSLFCSFLCTVAAIENKFSTSHSSWFHSSTTFWVSYKELVWDL